MPILFGWVTIVLFAAIDAVWMLAGGQSVAHPSMIVLTAAAGLVLVSLACRHRWPRRAENLQALAQNILLGPLLFLFAYLCITPDFPTRDAWLAAADKAVGFDWPELYRSAAASKSAMSVLAFLYFGIFVVENVAAYLVLPLISTRRNTEIILVVGVMTLMGAVVSMLVPVEGPLFYFNLPKDPNLHAGLVRALATQNGIRSGVIRTLDFAQLNGGIIVFPSFHAALALIFSYAARGTGRFFRVIAILNGMMLLSIPFVGGHYFVDVIAGMALAGLAIAAVRSIPRTWIAAVESIGRPSRFRSEFDKSGGVFLSGERQP